MKRFHNRIYRAQVGRTQAGSPILKIKPVNPDSRPAQRRQLAAFIYELAADMERRSDQLGARWVISPTVSPAEVVVELVSDGDGETGLADEFLAGILADFQLG